MDAPRCYCGRSRELPLCDGSHAALGWRSGAGGEGFVSGPAHARLAERLAHERGGRVGADGATSLVVVTDGGDLDEALRGAPTGCPRACVLVGRDVSPARVAAAAGASTWVRADGAEGALAGLAAPQPVQEAPTFVLVVGHAEPDRAELDPALERLGRLGVEIVRVAAELDSLASLKADVARAQAAVVVVSKSSARAHLLPFVAGMAAALGVPVGVVAFEPVPRPAYAKELAWVDVEQLLLERPWLDLPHAVALALLLAAPTP